MTERKKFFEINIIFLALPTRCDRTTDGEKEAKNPVTLFVPYVCKYYNFRV